MNVCVIVEMEQSGRLRSKIQQRRSDKEGYRRISLILKSMEGREREREREKMDISSNENTEQPTKRHNEVPESSFIQKKIEERQKHESEIVLTRILSEPTKPSKVTALLSLLHLQLRGP